MAQWMDIQISNGQVLFNGKPVADGETFNLGLGSIRLFFPRDQVVQVVRYSNTGREKYRRNIYCNGNWRIGADRIYRVIDPEEETDPFRKLLRQMKLPVAMLHHHEEGEKVHLQGKWVYLHCHVPNGVSSFLMTDSQEPIQEGELLKKRNTFYKEQGWSAVLSNTTYAVVLGEKANSSGRIYRRVWELHVWGDPDITPVADLIGKWMRGEKLTPQ